MLWPWVFISFAAGLLIGAVVARTIYTRQARAVRDAEDRARRAERLAEQGAMTGGLAHEIKNPLSTIGLNAQLLAEGIGELRGTPADEDVRPRLVNRVSALRRETERLRGILQDFLDYAGAVRLEKRPLDLNAVAGELVDFLTPEADRAGVRLRADLAPFPVVIPADVRLLKQALLNLLLNAIQACSDTKAGVPRGEVIVRVRPIERQVPALGKRARPTIERLGEVSVIDTGPGITPENLPKVFQPYFTTKGGGTGLGLPTSRRLIEEHTGTLTVQSEPGKGTMFSVRLPAGQEPPQ